MQPGIRGELFFADAEALYSYERTYQIQNLLVGKAITSRSLSIRGTCNDSYTFIRPGRLTLSRTDSACVRRNAFNFS
jgi:hypothetical protein